jgi:predicted O-methyltransferase YrrM
MRAETVLNDAGWAMDVAIEANNCHVDDTRNSLVREFLKSDCSDLLFIDADVSWRDEDLARLMSFDRDIVAGIYPKKTDKAEFPVFLTKGELRTDADGLLEVERVPTGFLRISRRVLETLAASAVQYRANGHSRDEAAYPLIFERSIREPDGRKWSGDRWSGDYHFCNLAKKAGFRIFVDPEMVFGHAGVKVWTGCLGAHLRERSGLDHPDFAASIRAIRGGDVSADTLIPLYLHSGSAFAATVEMLSACYHMQATLRGNTLECGSGISTIVLGLAAEKFGGTVYSLEHDIEWYDKVRRRLDRYGIESVRLIYAPLWDQDGCRWYECAPAVRKLYDLVVCDGPPRRFGREGLLKRLGPQIRGAAFIIDDTDDLHGQGLAKKLAAGREIVPIDVREANGRQFAIIPPAVRVKQPEPMRAFA